MRFINSLLLQWASEGVEPLPPESPDAVREAFACAGMVATTDVIALYGAIGGMRMMDKEYWRLWPLAEVREQRPSAHGVLFSDYLISCWEYRLKATSSDTSAVYIDRFDNTSPTLVAPSLESFFELYIADASTLLDAT